MAEQIFKELKTKIALKYLAFETWSAESFKAEKPLKGEVWFCEIPQSNTNATTAPTVLFKVGDGTNTFGDLQWCSALAADVHTWAKKSEADFINWVNTVVEHPAAPVITTGGANGTISVNGADVAVKGLGSAAYTDSTAYATAEQGGKADEAAATIATYGDIVTHNASEFAPANINTGVHAVDLATGDENGQVKLTVDGQSKNVDVKGLASAAYATVESLNATAKGYADAVEAKIPTELGVMSVANAEGDDTIVVDGDGKNVTLKVAPNKFDAHGAAAAVQDNLTAYEEAHQNDYTNSKIDELVQGAKDYADNNDANTEYHVEYDSTNKKIKLVAGADASKMEIDATEFIKDGMIDTVELVQQDAEGNKGQFLKLTWNDDGKDVTYVPVGALVDVYTASENAAEVQVAISNTNVVSATLVNKGITEAKLADEVTAKLNKTWEEAGTAARLDATLKTELQKEIDDDIAAYDASKKFGDIISHNASEFASSAENGAKELAQGVKDVVEANKVTWDKADSALQEVEVGEGLKVSEKADNKQKIEIDTAVIFVLNANF